MSHRFIHHIGLDIEESVPGTNRCTLEVQGMHLNSTGAVHGAVLFAMADTGMGKALYTTLNAGQLCATIEAKINYFKPVREGVIACTSKLVNRGKSIASLESTITVGPEVVARAFGTYTVFERKNQSSD
jgi:acyl-CoA thioesterase